MAVLQRMREKFGIAISVIIALSLLYFIAPMDDLMTLFGRPQNVGEIAGKAISYEDYQEEIDRFTTINQIVTGSSTQNEQTQKQIQNMAWQTLIDKYLFVKNAKAAGLGVGEAEMLDLTKGDNVSPMISGNPVFADENGQFSVDNLVEFVSSIDGDESGRSRLYWNYLQNTIYNQKFYAKYGALFTASDFANDLMVAKDSVWNNTTADVQYLTVQYPFEKDSTITVSSSEIKAFYKAHKNFFKQTASRDIEYVVFEVTPSQEDIAAVKDAFDKAYVEFGTAENMKTFLMGKSDRKLSKYWYKAGELKTVNAGIDKQIFDEGRNLTEVVKDGNTFYAAKVMDTAMVPDSVYVKHILLQGASAKATADSLVAVVRGGANFANLAAEFSADKGSNDGGVTGNLGWMSQAELDMIPGFGVLLDAAAGVPQVINTQYGSHVVVVEKKTAPRMKKQVAILEKTVIPSNETINRYYSDANRFVSIANGTLEGYRKAVDSLKVYSHTLNINEGTEKYGSIDNAKEVTRWAFESKKGKSSKITAINNQYFIVAALVNVHKDGFTPVEEVRDQIESKLYTDKLSEKTLAGVKEKIAGINGIEEAAKALGVEVQTKEGVSLSSTERSVEPALIGAVSAAQLNTVSAPVKGMMGVYVVNVTARETGSFYTAEDAKNYASQKAQYGSQMVIPVMMDEADVQDNRARYY